MPELPEVETVCRGLRPKLVGQKIHSIVYRRPNIRFDLPPALPDAARQQHITAVERASKYILIALESGGRILVHLGMSGRLMFYDTPDTAPAKHDHVLITLENGQVLAFNDARRFGVVDYLPPATTQHVLLERLGIDPFDPALDAAWLLQRAQKRRVTMKQLLMDQKIIAGLGNIYVCEALFLARINPQRLADTLTRPQAKRLVPAIRTVLMAAIDAGGSSLRDYIQVNGELGYFQKHFNVYGREDQPCVTCARPVQRLVQQGRSSFYCGSCQK